MPRASRVRYIPALSFHSLTRFYDPVVRLLLSDTVFKRRLIDQAHIGPHQRVLDLGCGTATLTIMVKRIHPNAEVVGIDPDRGALAIARAKAARAGTAITLEEALATELPYPDASFDRVVSSLVFHHLRGPEKLQAAREVLRVLRPGGELHVADFGRPHTRAMARIARIVGKLEHAEDNVRGRLPDIFRQAGFEEVRITNCSRTLFGTIALHAAHAPRERPS